MQIEVDDYHLSGITISPDMLCGGRKITIAAGIFEEMPCAKILNLQGHPIQDLSITLSDGKYSAFWETSKLSSGIYWVLVSASSGHEYLKILHLHR